MSKAFKENPVAKIARESNEYIDLLEGKLQTALDLIAHAEQKHAELQGRIAELEIDNEELHKLWAETIAENKGLEADNARLREAIKDDCPTSMVMCGCGKHYKKPPQTVCHICFMFDSAKTIVGLEEELAKYKTYIEALKSTLIKNVGLQNAMVIIETMENTLPAPKEISNGS